LGRGSECTGLGRKRSGNGKEQYCYGKEVDVGTTNV